jgi:hypothetical protein
MRNAQSPRASKVVQRHFRSHWFGDLQCANLMRIDRACAQEKLQRIENK